LQKYFISNASAYLYALRVAREAAFLNQARSLKSGAARTGSRGVGLGVAGIIFLFGMGRGLAAEHFRVATYNLQNYLLEASGGRPAKSEPARKEICGSILALEPDVVALQELGAWPALVELRKALAAAGREFQHWEYVSGADTNIHLAVLSRFPIVERRPHTNAQFVLHGRRFSVSRGFAEVTIQVNDSYRFTLLNAHLKSRLAVWEADESEIREQEARLLREKINELFAARPGLNLMVVGDFNDQPSSRGVRMIVGRGRNALIDTRPTERPALTAPGAPGTNGVAWTHYFAREETYQRLDYLLLSRDLAREWVRDGTFVLSRPQWWVASDHRPLVATFWAEDK
jgi:endonuclease/exonuclease/phosphatase family metal-dependent hydrolase